MTSVMFEYFNSILFHKSGPANKQHAYRSINESNKPTTIDPDVPLRVFELVSDNIINYSYLYFSV